MDYTVDSILEVALLASERGAEIMTTFRKDKSFKIHLKGETNLVTEADLASEKAIISTIKERFPHHGILSEEFFNTVEDPALYLEPLWIIDPIDGTTNYAHGHPHTAVSIAFADRGIVQVGVVYSPFVPEKFVAVKGRGATRNGEPISSTKETILRSALIGTGFPYEKEGIDVIMSRLRSVLLKCREVRRIGAASLDVCWVADGRLDGFYESVSPWDIAAASLIAREAGAKTSFINPKPKDSPVPDELYSKGFIIASHGIIDGLTELLRSSSGI